MPGFDFPNSPSNGQIATGPGGISYTFDGTKWAASSAGGVAYAPINSPSFTGDPQAPTPAVTDSDNSIASTAFVQAVAAPSANNAGRNLVMNGTFTVAQRGAGPWTATGYTVDRWRTYINLDTASFSQQPVAPGGIAGDESAVFLVRNIFTGNAGAASETMLIQCIEDVRRLAGKTVTISFYAIAAAGSPKLGASFDQYFGTGGSPSAGANGAGQSVTLTTTWARYSLTFAIPSIAAKTIGTAGDHSTNMAFWFSCGATDAVRAGNVGVQSGTISVWGVQLEIGSVATKLDYGGSPQQVLAECQRFYQTGQVFYGGYCAAGVGCQQSWAFPVIMRAMPTVVPNLSAATNTTGQTVNALDATTGRVLGIGVATGGFLISGTFTASADL